MPKMDRDRLRRLQRLGDCCGYYVCEDCATCVYDSTEHSRCNRYDRIRVRDVSKQWIPIKDVR